MSVELDYITKEEQTFVFAIEARNSQLRIVHIGARRRARLVASVWAVAVIVVDL
jgi:hypothetical protein